MPGMSWPPAGKLTLTVARPSGTPSRDDGVVIECRSARWGGPMTLTESQWGRIQARGIKGPEADERRFPFPVPNGWFAVAQSDDLSPGQTKNVHYFGRDLVVWREEASGQPHVVDGVLRPPRRASRCGRRVTRLP